MTHDGSEAPGRPEETSRRLHGPRSIGTQVALAGAVVLLATVGALAVVSRRDAMHIALETQLRAADEEVRTASRVAQAMLDVRFPGPWRMVAPIAGDTTLALWNGNARRDALRLDERVPALLYKGDVPVLGNVAMERELLRIDSLTGAELTIAQRLEPRRSTDSTVGEAPRGRALRLQTTVTRPDAAGLPQRVTLTVMPTRDPRTGVAVGAGAALAADSNFLGRAAVAGEDEFTIYQPIRNAAGRTVGVFFAGVPFARLEEGASAATAATHFALVAALSGVAGVLLLWLLTRRLLRPLHALRAAAEQVADGRLNVVLGATDRRDEVGAVARSFATLVAGQRELADTAAALAAGDMGVACRPRSDADALGTAMARMQREIATVVGEVRSLSESAQAGQLGHRGDAARFGGAFRDLVAGVNATLDGVTVPIQEVTVVLEAIARRDLSARATGVYRGDFALVQRAVNTAAENLDAALGEVGVAAAQVAMAGGHIASGSQTLAEGASSEAASLEEVGATMQEMAASARGCANNAQQAAMLADETRAAAVNGVARMSRLTEAVAATRASSEQTAKIVKTIDEIAFRTNLLALNAAVEAAHAGDAGRGFAVVAEEVRALALRTAEAARTTAELIEEGVRAAKRGEGLNGEVLQSLQEIADRADRVAQVVAEISTASAQQAEGVEQVNRTVELMSSVTQRVASSAEESAGAAEELAGQAASLNAVVEQFVLSATPA
jgi:methyl-accepting chemotaxis protein